MHPNSAPQSTTIVSPNLAPPPTQTPASPGDRPMQRKSRAAWWVILLIGLVAAGGTWWYRHSHKTATSTEEQAGSGGGGRRGGGGGNRVTPVVAVPATKGDLPIYLTGLGTVTPLNNVTVRSRVDGQIDDIKFEEGQTVKQGDLLIQIDPRPFQVQLAQAEGQMAKDQAALKNAQVELERYKQAADAIPKQQIDTQQATVDQAAAAVKVDQGQIDTAQLQLTYAKITAPITGRIGLRAVDRGNIIHASDQTGLALITQLQPISVMFTLPQDVIPQLMKRMSTGADLQVDVYDRDMQNKLAAGKLLAVDNQVDPASGTLRLKAQFDNKDVSLFPNQFVNARLLVDTRRGATLVPAAAIQRGPDSQFVYVVKSDDGGKADATVDVRNVTVGPTEGEQTVVESGVQPGDVVVTDGVDKLQPGAKVSVRGRGGPGGASTRPGGASSRPSSRPATPGRNAGSAHDLGSPADPSHKNSNLDRPRRGGAPQ